MHSSVHHRVPKGKGVTVWLSRIPLTVGGGTYYPGIYCPVRSAFFVEGDSSLHSARSIKRSLSVMLVLVPWVFLAGVCAAAADPAYLSQKSPDAAEIRSRAQS